MKLIYCCVILGLAATACATEPKRATESLLVSNELQLTHCRFGVPTNVTWQISEIALADLNTWPSNNYQIVKDFKNWEHASITILLGDRFDIVSAGTVAKLRHFRYDPKTWRPILVASAELALDNGHLWAKGDVYKPSSTDKMGEYFVYRIPDSDGTPRVCEHTKVGSGTSCSSVHIEFFDKNDTTMANRKPKLTTGNVVKLADVTACGTGSSQTGEGDGDEGPEE
jgi:hypothetical protein